MTLKQTSALIDVQLFKDKILGIGIIIIVSVCSYLPDNLH